LTAPDQPPVEQLRALVEHYNSGRLVEAAALAEALTRRYAAHPFAWKALGATARDLGHRDDAVRAWRNAARLDGDAESYNNLALVLQEAGELQQAETCFLEALGRRPDLVAAHANLGRLYQATGRPAEAEASLRHAIRLRPRLAEAHNTLAVVLRDSGRLAEAEASCRAAIACRPDYAEAHACHGAVLTAIGRLDEGEAGFRRALQLRPDYLEARSALLYVHHFRADRSVADDLEEARQYGRVATLQAKPGFTNWNAPATPPRLRVGLVSGDLREHPVGHFLEGLLAQVDRSRLEVIAYPTRRLADRVTERIRSHCDRWSPLYGQDDATAAKLIHADGVHVLFDLAGHSANGRLPVFARKPAPVQASWLGYFATTGVAEIDYLLADPVSVPSQHRHHFTERVWYLPDTRLCFTPPATETAVAPLPALGSGHVTFGSFQNLTKVNDAVLALWARVLGAAPRTRLRLQNRQLADPAVRRRLLGQLASLGIAADRLSMHGPVSRDDYLEAHREVDLILDTFPFPGGTTTCEALWMGVPTLTLAGDRMIGLQGASLLAAAGLADWIARSPDDYVDRALALAADAAALAALRAQLRGRVLASPLFDARRFARNFEDAVWGMWRDRQAAPAE
jgi:predicted O-linked N-acetylglucosamine transferase (SPINDLY family)